MCNMNIKYTYFVLMRAAICWCILETYGVSFEIRIFYNGGGATTIFLGCTLFYQ